MKFNAEELSMLAQGLSDYVLAGIREYGPKWPESETGRKVFALRTRVRTLATKAKRSEGAK